VNPEYVEKITDTEVIFRNYEGKRFRYPLTSTPLESKVPEAAPVTVEGSVVL
jgi:lysine 2,3-aminomutase